MRPVVATQTTTGAGSVIPLDIYIAPFQVSVAVTTDGSADYDVQHTFDDIFDPTVTPSWFTSSNPADYAFELLQEDGNLILQENGDSLLLEGENNSVFIDFPVRAVRTFVYSTTGTVTTTVIQAGIR